MRLKVIEKDRYRIENNNNNNKIQQTPSTPWIFFEDARP